jgi:hypothetical protein
LNDENHEIKELNQSIQNTSLTCEVKLYNENEEFYMINSKKIQNDSFLNCKRFVCTIENCSSAFTRKNKLTNHMKIKHQIFFSSSFSSSVQKNKKDWKCDSCEKTYKYKSSLRKHTEAKHTNNKMQEKPLSGKNEFQCDQCDRSYKYPGDLKYHQQLNHFKSSENIQLAFAIIIYYLS